MSKNTAYIVAATRTACGKANKGSLRFTRPDSMGGEVVKDLLNRTKGLEAEQVEDVIMGCAFPEASQGLNMARQIALLGGLPDSVPGVTVNRFCSSGLQTIAMAAERIMAGGADVIIAGGVESMSLVPMGGMSFQPNPDLVDEKPGVYVSMGITAENVAKKYDVSREDQDEFAYQSHKRAIKAWEQGKFEGQITPIKVHEKKVTADGEVVEDSFTFKQDEGPRKDTSVEALSGLRPAFKSDGSVTAGNSSQMNDAAAGVVVVSGEMVEKLGLEPMARYVGFQVAGVAPEIMGIGPVEAVPKVLKKSGLQLSDIDLIELNEAFASQSLAVIRKLGLDKEITNVNGGAIAMGHPLGCTGAKLSTQILYEMKARKSKYGLVTMCIGGGMGAAGIFENLN
ncbi:MAG: acetyl-CoA C-acyltransferase [Balneola sp.]|nr:acetyl-CoA C-acyltransferase [Balneola sp.]MBE78433.1 acetyl-CoA C-acyltransferase [Balneola sp.]|tara:strand:+ start:661 stop:1848 length:1188 start_codon:yes stop_codon:yes gene_type:complete